MRKPEVYEIIEMYYKNRNNDDVPLEYFVLPFKKNRYMIYFPRKGMLSLVNKAFIDNIEKNNPLVNELFRAVSKNPSVEMHNVKLKDNIIMLELTKNCNLKCIYCYGHGGDKSEYLDWKTAKAGIDWVLKRCHKKLFTLSFHGGGEPLLAFPMMKRCCEYTKKECKKRGIKFGTNATTNGTLITEDMAKWFKKIGMHLAISFDGMPEVQNRQRPFGDNSPSYEIVKNAINLLNKHSVWYTITSTVTDKSVSNIPDSVKYIKDLRPKSWTISYIMECGRCSKTGAEKPKYNIFLKNAEKAKKECKKCGIDISTTKKIDFLVSEEVLSTNNCYACGEHAVITSSGYISSCGTITNEKNPITKEFFYGKIKDGKIIINKKKLEHLRNRTVDKMPQCINCFAKYLCRGTCLAEAAREGGNIYHTFEEECKINKERSYNFLKSKFA